MSQQNREAAGIAASPRERRNALLVCMAGGFIIFLDVSIVNVALPTISHQLHASGSLLQWLVSGYSLAFGLLLVPSGRLGDIFGHRLLFTIGLAAFVIASAVCGAAPSATVLVIARIAQGATGGILNPQISATIQQLYQGPERGKAFGYFASVVSVGSAVGPVAGGALIAAFGVQAGWRAVFFVNVPVGAVLVVMAVRLLPPHERTSGPRPGLDLPGSGLLGAGIALILLPFIEGGWGIWRWSLLAGAAAVLAAFVRREQRATDPVLDLRLLRNSAYATGVSLITLYFAAFTPMFFVFTLMLQLGHGYSALGAGLAITPFAAGAAVAGPFAGSLAARHGRDLVAAGLTLMLIGFAGSAVAVSLTAHDVAWAAFAPVFIAGVGGGVTLAPNQSLTLAAVPIPQAGAAGGFYQTGQRIGASIGVAAAGSAFFAALDSGKSFAAAYSDAVVVMSAIIMLALALALADRRRATVAARRVPES